MTFRSRPSTAARSFAERTMRPDLASIWFMRTTRGQAMRHQCQRVYTGKRLSNGAPVVHVIAGDGESRLLRIHPTKCDYSRTFEWGYPGSGPSQLAFEILYDALGDREIALDLCQRFKFARIVPLPHEQPWKIT